MFEDLNLNLTYSFAFDFCQYGSAARPSIVSSILGPVFLRQVGRLRILWIFLVFRKGVLLLITTYCIIYLFLHVFIFPDRASIFGQLSFFTFHRSYFTLQQ